MWIVPFAHLDVSNHRALFSSLAEIRLLCPHSSGLSSEETFDRSHEYLMKMKITTLSEVQPTSVFFIFYIPYHHSAQ
jgi:hypothetical protein